MNVLILNLNMISHKNNFCGKIKMGNFYNFPFLECNKIFNKRD
jgi:hypothetical protein